MRPAMSAVRPTIMIAVPLIIEKIYKTRIQPELVRRALVRRLSRFGPTRKLLMRLFGRSVRKAFGGCLRMFCMGGASLSAETAVFLDESKFPLHGGIRIDRGGSAGHGRSAGDLRLRLVRPTVARRRGPAGRSRPGHGRGEIEVKGPNVMAGYYPSPGRGVRLHQGRVAENRGYRGVRFPGFLVFPRTIEEHHRPFQRQENVSGSDRKPPQHPAVCRRVPGSGRRRRRGRASVALDKEQLGGAPAEDRSRRAGPGESRRRSPSEHPVPTSTAGFLPGPASGRSRSKRPPSKRRLRIK
ncbi:MAG: hypothetical protein MZV63_47040 [Marinilabiliales bacterium]|nr:hypothetical protein [Marinilabiliales bacterium]